MTAEIIALKAATRVSRPWVIPSRTHSRFEIAERPRTKTDALANDALERVYASGIMTGDNRRVEPYRHRTEPAAIRISRDRFSAGGQDLHRVIVSHQ